jgi:hypothetical protein
MRLFKCQNCGQVVYFDNTTCERCSSQLGFLPETMQISALKSAQPANGAPQATESPQQWTALVKPETLFRFCDNAGHAACNWLIEANAPETLCAACRHNRTIPDLSVPENLTRWQKLEAAKHRLFYTLMRLRLPLVTRQEDPEHGLAFDFLADSPDPSGPKVMTGHDNGLITIALAEADDAERERRRTQMNEPYRSLLGHFRHEIGHYFWDVLVRDAGKLDACRAVFGDDTQDYSAAIDRHYKEGPPADWQNNFVSQYATMHPWEDWAETWAHYLHIIDTLEMASAFGIRVQPRITRDETLAAEIDLDPYQNCPMQEIIDAWLPLTFAMNALNRAMGNPDLYPFVLSPAVIGKLGFVHRLVHEHKRGV